MATSLDQVNAQRTVEEKQGSKYSEKDVELVVLMGVELLTKGGGLDLIRKAINQSKDPAQVVGQLLSQIVAKLAESVQEGYGIDPGIFLAKDGFLDYILNYIEKKLGYPKEFSDEIYTQVLEIIKAAALGPEAPNNVMDPSQQDPSMGPPQQQMMGQPPGPNPQEVM